MTDSEYMRAALELAKQGCGKVDPNPLVGAILVKDGKVIGKGFHQKYGGLHAERNALADCTESPVGATLYVTLEPCCHWGKTPPCTDAILAAGIRRVVIGSSDPNPLVNGKGVRILREHGVEVTEGIFQKECDQLNEPFLYYIQTKLPFVILKYAMSMDGKIAAVSGKSQWITGEIARQRVQQDRNRYMALMTGVGTVLADNPRLTCRIPDSRNPVRIVCDTHLRTPVSSYIVATAAKVPTVLATCCTDAEKQIPYRKAGCEILMLPEKNKHTDLKALVTELGAKGIGSILLEGGAALNWSALQSGIVNKVQAYIAPKILGGAEAKTPVGGLGADSPDHAFHLTEPTVTRLGSDLLLESRVV